ncbi:MAG: hypothetical protein NUV46_04495 [Nanoarchaeota archaeon]|nr:hypothetical protein [Nanoarchaeota archaeon]
MKWSYLVPMIFLLFPQKQNLSSELFSLEKRILLKDDSKQDSTLIYQYPPHFGLKKNGTFSKNLSFRYLMTWDEKKVDLGKGERWYVEALYDFNDDDEMDKIALFRMTDYNFEEGIPKTDSLASIVISDEDKDGVLDMRFLDEDGDGLLEKVSKIQKKKNVIKRT